MTSGRRPRRVVLATANPDKAVEIHQIVGDRLELIPRPSDVPDVDETEETLVGNARLKAVALCAATGLPALADDTGLEVDAFGGKPGVHTARYAGEGASHADNRAKMLRELAGVPAARRTARFRTVALLRWPDGRELAVEGTVDGVIAEAERGDRGWGYDPLFTPSDDNAEGRTFAQMSEDEKHARSHRGRAFRALADALDALDALGAPDEDDPGPD